MVTSLHLFFGLLSRLTLSPATLNAAANRVSLDRNDLASPTMDYNSANVNLVLRQTLYRQNQWVQLDQAQAQLRGTQAELERAALELAIRMAGQYFEVLYADDQIAQLEAQRSATQGQLLAAQRGFELGQGTRTDVDEALAKMDMVLAQALQARQQGVFARQQLAASINQDVGDLQRLDSRHEPGASSEVGLKDWIDRAEAASPELRLAQVRLELARLDLVKARSGHLPTLDLVGQRSLSRQENTINPLSSYQSKQIGLQLNLPLYAGGAVESAMRQASAAIERETQLLEQTRRGLGLQVRKELQNVDEGVARVAALAQAARSAEQLVISTRKGMAAGTRTQTDLLNAVQRGSEAGRDLSLARYQQLLARQRLLALTGAAPQQGIDAINRLLLR